MKRLTLTGIALVAVAWAAACSDTGVVAPDGVVSDGPPAIRADHLPNMQCETVDFDGLGLAHGDAITSVTVLGETITFTATRNDPAGAVNATAYDTDYAVGDGGCANLLDGTHNDTQIPASTGLATPPGICAACDQWIMVIPDVDFCVDGDDTQGGMIDIAFPAGDWEIVSYDAVDRDDAPVNTVLEVEIGAVLTEVGNTNCPNPNCGDGQVVNVQTTDHVFQNLARFTNPGSGGIDNIEICKDFPPPPGGDGCTPGYWKVRPHLDSWPPTGYSPNQLFSSVFEDAFPGMTLRDVLRQGGGGLKALGRHTVAALLNAAHPGVAYDLTEAMVINQFNAVYPGGNYEAQKDIFEAFNEQGCPIN